MAATKGSSLPDDVSPEVRSGSHLVGEDFDDDQLKRWFAEEQEAFYEDDAGNSEKDPWYAYMRYVNEVLGFATVSKHADPIQNVLVLGPGSGIEIEQFATKHPACKLNFLEASESFKLMLRDRFCGATILEPQYTGSIALSDESQDVVCAFSVLHHIPNVSKVVTEIGRVTKSGGFLMVREPCSSMGDWRKPRSATPNERGISRALMTRFAADAGFTLERQPIPILFEPFNRILKKTIGFRQIPFPILFGLDRLTSKFLSLNDHYWRDSLWRKLGPSSYFYIFRKL